MQSIGDFVDFPLPLTGPKHEVGEIVHATFNSGICKAEILQVTNRVGQYTYDVRLLTDCEGSTGVIPAGTETWVFLEQIVVMS